jgi:hypothetical protein
LGITDHKSIFVAPETVADLSQLICGFFEGLYENGGNGWASRCKCANNNGVILAASLQSAGHLAACKPELIYKSGDTAFMDGHSVPTNATPQPYYGFRRNAYAAANQPEQHSTGHPL